MTLSLRDIDEVVDNAKNRALQMTEDEAKEYFGELAAQFESLVEEWDG